MPLSTNIQCSEKNSRSDIIIKDLALKVQGLEHQLVQETEKRKQADRNYESIKQEFGARLNERLQELRLAQTAQESLNDSLLEIATKIEKTHESFVNIVDDLDEGIRAKAGEFTNSASEQAKSKEQNPQLAFLNEIKKASKELQDSKGQIESAVDQLKDLVKERTKQLQVSEDRYKSIFRRVRDGIFIADSKWSFNDANPAMREILACKHRHLTNGLNLRDDIFSDKYSFEVFEKEVIISGFIANYETKFRTVSGELMDVMVSCSAIWGENNTLAGYEGIVRNITEQKKLEEQRLKMQRLEAVHNIIITINHNMNQNLTVIYNCCQMLREKLDDSSPYASYFNMIYAEVEKLIDLLRKISLVKDIRTTEYIDGVQMLDLEKSISDG